MVNLEYISNIYLVSDDQLVDISDLVYQIDIYQSIYDSLVTGNLLLREGPSSRLSKLFRETLVGKGERLIFSLKTKTKPASKSPDQTFDFFVYKVTVIPLHAAGLPMGQQALTLNFSSRNIFLNEFKKVTNFYYDTISNVAASIAKNQLGIDIIDIEETKDKQFIIIPNLPPLESISWLAARAYSTPETSQNFDITTQMMNAASSALNRSKIPDIVNNNYVFYEDSDRNYHFTSIGSMFLKEPVIGEIDKEGIVLKIRKDKGLESYSSSFSAIQHISKPISALSNVKNGMYASTCLTFDLTRKKYAKKVMKYNDLFQTQSHFYNKQLVNSELDPTLNILNNVYEHPEAVQKYYAKSSYIFSPTENPLKGNTPNNTVDKWVLQRTSAMESMDQQGVDVEIRGNVGVQLGDVVMFSRQDINNTVDPKFSKYIDNAFVGKFLITRIKHTLENVGETLGFNLRTCLSLRRDCDYGGQ